ncbi:MAG: polysaccharide deacetylase family protein [Phycisphaeraceae bacterium]|nr:polysaccharide deacetylase family protein [Phycisphaeraceae bacterium]
MSTVAPLPSHQKFTWPNGKRCAVSLSFDDARVSQVDTGLPILRCHGVRATFYVIMSNVEQRLAGWRAAVDAGHEIGNHTVTHPCSGNFIFSRATALENRTLADMERDLDDATSQIQARLSVTPTTFAYPCGQTWVGRGEELQSYVPLVARKFAVGRGFKQESDNDPAFCDLAQVAGTDFDRQPFEQLSALVLKAAEHGRWLVLAGHDVGTEGKQSVAKNVLDEFCRYCLDPANGVWIDTVATVGAYVRKIREG